MKQNQSLSSKAQGFFNNIPNRIQYLNNNNIQVYNDLFEYCFQFTPNERKQFKQITKLLQWFSSGGEKYNVIK